MNKTKSKTIFIKAENYSNYDSDIANLKMASLSTSIFSIPSSSINMFNTTNSDLNPSLSSQAASNSKLQKNDSLAQLNLKQNFIYAKLNQQRLELLDLLLDYGADKYLVAKLSESTLKQMNKKSLNMLKKWFASSDASSEQLRAISPIMVSVCLDDVEAFARLYKHHQNLFTYFKPDEDYELIYYAIRFQSKKCLIYLLTHANSDASLSQEKSFEKINQNTNTMFYILENTRSSKIISVLLKCGFDLCKREAFTGNTALHCLFNANSINNRLEGLKNYGIESPHYIRCNTNTEDIISSLGKRNQILNEFNTPHSLSKILFRLLKHGGLKSFVNTLNYENKCCTQVLFEWDELIDLVFFDSIGSEWKREFEECVKLLLKSGADLFMANGSVNCILTLLETILKNAKQTQAINSE